MACEVSKGAYGANQLTPLGRVLLGKTEVGQLIDFFLFYGIQKFIAVLIRTRIQPYPEQFYPVHTFTICLFKI
jgi:hypothetical protein